MKKIIVFIIVIALGFGYYTETNNLEKKYGQYEIVFADSGETCTDFKKNLFVSVFEKHSSEWVNSGIGNNFSTVDSSLDSDELETMRKGIAFTLTNTEDNKDALNGMYIYEDGYLFKFTGKEDQLKNPDELTQKSYGGHIQFDGSDRWFLQYIVFLNQ